MGSADGTPPLARPAAAAPPLVEVLTVLQRTAARTLAEALAEDGCTVDQWRVLHALADGRGHAMGELAADLVIPQASLTRLVDGLADLGLVYRRQGDGDRRRVELRLSRQGRTRLDRLDAVVTAHEERLRDEPAWAELTRVLHPGG
jgi:DNA-binding MarR family transcriptional regulator